METRCGFTECMEGWVYEKTHRELNKNTISVEMKCKMLYTDVKNYI